VQLSRLRDDVSVRSKKVDSSSIQLERHAIQSETFSKDLTSMGKKMGNLDKNFAQMLEIQSKATRERAEGVCERLGSEMQKLLARVRN